MRASLRDIAIALPEEVVTNAQLQAEHPDWNFALLADKIGVLQRHISCANETALDLGERACQQLFAQNPRLAETLDLLIFCTQTADYVLPPNSCVLHGRLGLPEHVAAMDITHACSGYIYALYQAQAFVRAGMAKQVLIVTADTYSKLIHSSDRSARVLFGDGAAATWLDVSDSSAGIIDVVCHTSGKNFDRFIVQAGGCRLPRSEATQAELIDDHGNVRTAEHIYMSGRDILGFVSAKIPKHVNEVLARNHLTVEQVDLFVFHQASAMVLDSLARLLKLPASKVYQNLSSVGNTVSASIPIAIYDARKCGRLQSGATVLLCGFGVGLSWGSVLLRLP